MLCAPAARPEKRWYNLGHEWPKKMINLLLEENTKRNEGEAVFPEYVGMIYDECVIEGIMGK